MKKFFNIIIKILIGFIIVYTFLCDAIMVVITYELQQAPGIFEKLEVISKHKLYDLEGFALSTMILNCVLLLVMFLFFWQKVKPKRNILA